MKAKSLLLIVLAIAIPAGTAPAIAADASADWPFWRGPGRDG